MPRSRRATPEPASPRRLARNRHGRGPRSSIVGPYLPMLRSRIDEFDVNVATTAGYLKGLWPDDLDGVSFEVAQAPDDALHGDHIDRWRVHHDTRRIVFFRLPIMRFSHTTEGDELRERMLVESCVYRAVAELLGKEPWELAPDRYRHW
ncbi:metallopeptidase family protein [Agromyces atrinae]|uniref:Metallopeptidase family protein n=1 Tax=Agromyces atrinae TaxID=592376 RepID=A0A4Q2MB49_9MICO|nr:metallopeptidase family protein [Agromyces atrinae]MCI2958040.1 metallopeptidase family protein [Agromyces atrinae]NYD66655.1 hypothetical protein [Agromyces atrinae]RXZ87321.1 metallopeptidase family protein [Agromyces atrinae]